MHSSTRTAAGLGIDPDDIHDEYERNGFDDLTDAQLFDRSAASVAIPRQQAANSFVLHAPLELMARRLLLPLVPRRLRRAARERLAWVAAPYQQSGAPRGAPHPQPAHESVEAARRSLLAALQSADLDGVDVAAAQFLAQATVDQVMALAEPTIDLLSAAGHAPIGFFLASRLATTS